MSDYSFISAGTPVTDSGNLPSRTVTIPAGAQGGDLLLLSAAVNTATTLTTPSGWTLIGTTTGGALALYDYWRIAAGSPGSASSDAGTTVTLATPVSSKMSAIAYCYRGGDPVTPIVPSSYTGAGETAAVTTHTFPAYTTTERCLVIKHAGDKLAPSSTGVTFSTGYTSRGVAAGTGTASETTAAADSGTAVASGSAVGGDTWTGTVAANSAASALFALRASRPAPTAAYTYAASGLAVTFDASASAPVSGDTITGYAWNFGDSTTGTGVGPSHTYASPGAKTVTLTVTDSNGITSTATQVITVTAPGASAGPVALVTTTGWTASPDLLTAISDTDASTFALSPANPAATLLRVTLGPLIAPAAGTDMTVTVEADATGATTGTCSAKLYEGSTVRATAAAQSLAMAATGSNTSSVLTFTFPAASIANVTSWNALQLELAVTAA